MNTEEIKKIIVDQKEEINETFEKEKIITRTAPNENLMHFLKYPNILAILGARRSGKSIFSNLLLKGKKYGYLNFDDERISNIKPEDLGLILQAFYELYGSDVEYFILDEIQNVQQWELFANRLRRTKKIILTGSNSKLLSGELATHLTGRHMDFTLYPFSFHEFLTLKDIKPTKEDIYSTKKSSEIKKHLRQYISLGGFPEAYKFGKAMLIKTYEDILQKDILLRYKIKNKTAFKELTKYLISNVSNEITFTRLKDIASVKNDHTIKNYVDYLSTAYLIFLVERFSFKLKNQTIAPKKIYCIDTGIINSIAFSFSENFGKIIENLVAVALLRRKSYWQSDLELYYWKDYQHREVDFIIKKETKVEQLIQVTAASEKNEIEKREYNSLLKASEELRCKNLLMITWDYEAKEIIDGKQIVSIPLWKWLLSEKN
jgi:hypothetical protein